MQGFVSVDDRIEVLNGGDLLLKKRIGSGGCAELHHQIAHHACRFHVGSIGSRTQLGIADQLRRKRIDLLIKIDIAVQKGICASRCFFCGKGIDFCDDRIHCRKVSAEGVGVKAVIKDG